MYVFQFPLSSPPIECNQSGRRYNWGHSDSPDAAWSGHALERRWPWCATGCIWSRSGGGEAQGAHRRAWVTGGAGEGSMPVSAVTVLEMGTDSQRSASMIQIFCVKLFCWAHSSLLQMDELDDMPDAPMSDMMWTDGCTYCLICSMSCIRIKLISGRRNKITLTCIHKAHPQVWGKSTVEGSW